MSETKKPIITEEKQYSNLTPIPKKPDDVSGLNIEAHFKISDPETNEVIVEGRA